MMNIVGTRVSLALRVLQFVCSTGSAVAMMLALYRYVPFRFLSYQMAVLSIWSLTLAGLDVISMVKNWDLHNIFNIWIYVIGDSILAIGSLAAISSAGGVVVLLEIDLNYCSPHSSHICSLYQLSVILGSMAWTFITASSVSTFFLLVALYEE